jgi:hypothetical protein
MKRCSPAGFGTAAPAKLHGLKGGDPKRRLGRIVKEAHA